MAKKKELLPIVAPERSASVESLIEQAIVHKVDVNTMERLLAMRDKIKAEQSLEAFNSAMASFQGAQPTIVKDKIVKDKEGKERYRYAPIDSIHRQTKENIRDNGFSYTTDSIVEDNWVTAICKVTHTLGHSEISSFKVPVDKEGYMSAPQKFASALTFAKRYAFCNAFGILTGDEDTDANFDQEPIPDDVIPTVTYDDHENVPATPKPTNTGTLAMNNKPWQKRPIASQTILEKKDKIKKLIDTTTLIALEGKKEYEDYVYQATGLKLSEQSGANLDAIITRLETLK